MACAADPVKDFSSQIQIMGGAFQIVNDDAGIERNPAVAPQKTAEVY
jgi:hypothetical protein